MSLHPFVSYLFKNASREAVTKHEFADQIQANSNRKNDTGNRLRAALRFLEMNCSLLYGYPGECFVDNGKIIKLIPTTFDSAFILPLLSRTGIKGDVIKTLLTFLKNDQREAGFWNYFLLDDTQEYDLIPEDIDVTSVVIMSLFIGKTLSREECILISEKMQRHYMFDSDGLLGTYLQKSSTEAELSRKVLWKDFLTRPRIDIGSCLNHLWLLSSLGMDYILKSTEFEPTLKLIATTIEKLEKNENNITHAKYYNNPNVLLFLLSRFVSASKFGAELFKVKLTDIILKKLENNNVDDVYNGNTESENKQENVVELACQIIAAINMNLHNDRNHQNVKVLISLKMEKMLSLQLQDGSFPGAPIYQWAPYNMYTGSKAMSTAFASCAIIIVLDIEHKVC